MSIDLSTSYMGLKLKNPVIIGSSGLTENVENIIKAEKYGAAAVVLKSLFEEQIMMDIDSQKMNNIFDTYSDVENYVGYYTKQHSLNNYLSLISEAKQKTNIPVIASINCSTAGEWTSFARKIENAGADALELNIFILPSDSTVSGIENEKTYFDIIKAVKAETKIPLAIKISHYFSGFAKFATELSETGIDSLVFFNRFFSPDIDIRTGKIISSHLYSTPADNGMVLRWTGIMSKKLSCDLAATTGIHDAETVIKNIMAGAKAIQIASVLYNKGISEIAVILKETEKLFAELNISSIPDICGIAAQDNITHPAVYERSQFMKYFSDSGK